MNKLFKLKLDKDIFPAIFMFFVFIGLVSIQGCFIASHLFLNKFLDFIYFIIVKPIEPLFKTNPVILEKYIQIGLISFCITVVILTVLLTPIITELTIYKTKDKPLFKEFIGVTTINKYKTFIYYFIIFELLLYSFAPRSPIILIKEFNPIEFLCHIGMFVVIMLSKLSLDWLIKKDWLYKINFSKIKKGKYFFTSILVMAFSGQFMGMTASLLKSSIFPFNILLMIFVVNSLASIFWVDKEKDSLNKECLLKNATYFVLLSFIVMNIYEWQLQNLLVNVSLLWLGLIYTYYYSGKIWYLKLIKQAKVSIFSYKQTFLNYFMIFMAYIAALLPVYLVETKIINIQPVNLLLSFVPLLAVPALLKFFERGINEENSKTIISNEVNESSEFA